MTRPFMFAILALLLATISACTAPQPDAPPAIFLDDDMCAQCGMIISDKRFAGATIVRNDREEQEPLLFDDFNCMVTHEQALTEYTVVRRWVHDHGTGAWVNAREATYLCSPSLRTPMASHVAAFEQRTSAASMRNSIGGDIQDFQAVWRSLSLNSGCADATNPEQSDSLGKP